MSSENAKSATNAQSTELLASIRGFSKKNLSKSTTNDKSAAAMKGTPKSAPLNTTTVLYEGNVLRRRIWGIIYWEKGSLRVEQSGCYYRLVFTLSKTHESLVYRFTTNSAIYKCHFYSITNKKWGFVIYEKNNNHQNNNSPQTQNAVPPHHVSENNNNNIIINNEEKEKKSELFVFCVESKEEQSKWGQIIKSVTKSIDLKNKTTDVLFEKLKLAYSEYEMESNKQRKEEIIVSKIKIIANELLGPHNYHHSSSFLNSEILSFLQTMIINNASIAQHLLKKLDQNDLRFDINDKSSILGHGGFSTVIKGVLFDDDDDDRQHHNNSNNVNDGKNTNNNKTNNSYADIVINKNEMKQTIERNVAIKIINSEESPLLSPFDLTSLRRELSILTFINHKNIIRYFGYCYIHSNYYIATELAHSNLLSFIQNSKSNNNNNSSKNAISWKKKHQFVVDICDAIQHLHYFKIAHRDLKSENCLLVTENDVDRIKIADFGISRSQQNNAQTVAVGTFNYMSPEILNSVNGVISADLLLSSDIYSLAHLIYAIMQESEPHDGQSVAEIAKLAQSGNPLPINASKWPKPWIPLIKRCWSVDPLSRPSIFELYDSFSLFVPPVLVVKE